MWVQFLDDASTAEQSQINQSTQMISINGSNVCSLRDFYAVFKEAEGEEVEVIVRCPPPFLLISGRSEYRVRNLEVKNVFEVDENGLKRQGATAQSNWMEKRNVRENKSFSSGCYFLRNCTRCCFDNISSFSSFHDNCAWRQYCSP